VWGFELTSSEAQLFESLSALATTLSKRWDERSYTTYSSIFKLFTHRYEISAPTFQINYFNCSNCFRFRVTISFNYFTQKAMFIYGLASFFQFHFWFSVQFLFYKYFKVCEVRIYFEKISKISTLSPFHKKRTVRLPSGCDPHGYLLSTGNITSNLPNVCLYYAGTFARTMKTFKKGKHEK
jgi:hypothetical protein